MWEYIHTPQEINNNTTSNLHLSPHVQLYGHYTRINLNLFDSYDDYLWENWALMLNIYKTTRDCGLYNKLPGMNNKTKFSIWPFRALYIKIFRNNVMAISPLNIPLLKV